MFEFNVLERRLACMGTTNPGAYRMHFADVGLRGIFPLNMKPLDLVEPLRDAIAALIRADYEVLSGIPVENVYYGGYATYSPYPHTYRIQTKGLSSIYRLYLVIEARKTS